MESIDIEKFTEMWLGPMTMTEIGEHFGIHRNRVSQIGRDIGLPSRSARSGMPCKPVMIGGVKYASRRAATRGTNISSAAIKRAELDGCLSDIKPGKRKPYRGRKIEIDGVTYRSMAEASRCTDLAMHKIRLIAETQREVAG